MRAQVFALIAITCLAGTSIYVDNIEQDIIDRFIAAARHSRPDVQMTAKRRENALANSSYDGQSTAPACHHICAVDGKPVTSNQRQPNSTAYRSGAVFTGGERTLNGVIDSADRSTLCGIGAAMDPTNRIHQSLESSRGQAANRRVARHFSQSLNAIAFMYKPSITISLQSVE